MCALGVAKGRAADAQKRAKGVAALLIGIIQIVYCLLVAYLWAKDHLEDFTEWLLRQNPILAPLVFTGALCAPIALLYVARNLLGKNDSDSE